MSEETLNFLDQLVQHEVEYRLFSLVMTLVALIGVVVLCIWYYKKDKQIKQIRKAWYDTLTDEQKKAIKQERELKL